MIHPSYVDLMEVVNKNVEEGETPVINSRYSIVMATAKRARQIVDGDEPLVKVSRGEKPLSIAVDELNQGEIRILAEDEVEEDFLEIEEIADGEVADGEEMISGDTEDGESIVFDSVPAGDEILPEEEMPEEAVLAADEAEAGDAAE